MIITIYAKHGKREALRKQIIDLGTGCDVRNADGAARFAALRMTCSEEIAAQVEGMSDCDLVGRECEKE